MLTLTGAIDQVCPLWKSQLLHRQLQRGMCNSCKLNKRDASIAQSDQERGQVNYNGNLRLVSDLALATSDLAPNL